MPNSEIKTHALLPRLRFPEFQKADVWEMPELKDITLPVEERVGERQLTPVSISAGVGFVPQAEKFGRDISGNQYKLYTVVRDGDFVYNKGNSLKFPQGCVYDLQGWGEVAAPNVFICFRLKSEYENVFFRYCFERNIHGIQLKKHITSGARSNGLLNISKEAFFGVKVPTPKPAEQRKIADCLYSIDELISAESKKLDTLKMYKKGLMQSLFPADGETVPKLRITEFCDSKKWTPKNIGSICKSYSGGTPNTSSKEYYGGDIPFIRSAEIDKEHTELFLTSAGLTNSAAKVVAKGDVLIALYGANSGDVALAKIDGAINQAILCLKASDNNAFIYHYLSHLKERIVSKYIQGGQGNLSGEIIKSIVLFIPTPKEQEKIADSLSVVDNLITAEDKKLELLKEHKKGLMQQLFPSQNEVQG